LEDFEVAEDEDYEDWSDDASLACQLFDARELNKFAHFYESKSLLINSSIIDKGGSYKLVSKLIYSLNSILKYWQWTCFLSAQNKSTPFFTQTNPWKPPTNQLNPHSPDNSPLLTTRCSIPTPSFIAPLPPNPSTPFSVLPSLLRHLHPKITTLCCTKKNHFSLRVLCWISKCLQSKGPCTHQGNHPTLLNLQIHHHWKVHLRQVQKQNRNTRQWVRKSLLLSKQWHLNHTTSPIKLRNSQFQRFYLWHCRRTLTRVRNRQRWHDFLEIYH
jgi:hypothetical protein